MKNTLSALGSQHYYHKVRMLKAITDFVSVMAYFFNRILFFITKNMFYLAEIGYNKIKFLCFA